VREDFVVVTVVENEPQAEIACAALRAEGIDCLYRHTNFAAGSLGGVRGGPEEILVPRADAERARELLGVTG
jgi:cell division septation protein DedD